MANPNIGKVGRHFLPGQSGNPGGRPAGSKNRSTIAREVLDMPCDIPDEIFEKLLPYYPALTRKTTIEKLATLVQMARAIKKEDVNSYKAVLDSSYGGVKQSIEMEVNDVTDEIDYSELSEAALEEIANLKKKQPAPEFDQDDDLW